MIFSLNIVNDVDSFCSLTKDCEIYNNKIEDKKRH